MIEFLISLLIFVVIFAVIWWALSQFPLPDPLGKIIRVIVVLIFAIALIYMLRGLLHGPWVLRVD